MNHRKNRETNEETSMKNSWRTKLKTENEESSEMMAFGGSQSEEFMKNLERTGQDLRETLLRSSNVENEDEKCHAEFRNTPDG